MQSDLYKKLDEGENEWLRCNIDPKKTSPITNMQEQIIETRAWKRSRDTHIDLDKRTVHLASGFQMLAGNK